MWDFISTSIGAISALFFIVTGGLLCIWVIDQITNSSTKGATAYILKYIFVIGAFMLLGTQIRNNGFTGFASWILPTIIVAGIIWNITKPTKHEN